MDNDSTYYTCSTKIYNNCINTVAVESGYITLDIYKKEEETINNE